MLFDRPLISVQEFEASSGWHVRPEGLCRDEVCIPFTPTTDQLNLAMVAASLDMPLVENSEASLWALGPRVATHALTSARAPDVVLPDVHGQPFDLKSLRRKKVLLLAWASW